MKKTVANRIKWRETQNSHSHPGWVSMGGAGIHRFGHDGVFFLKVLSFLPRWRPYDLKSRATMIVNLHSQVQNDPYSEIRRVLLDSSKQVRPEMGSASRET